MPNANEPAAGSPKASSATTLPAAIAALTTNVPIIADARARVAADRGCTHQLGPFGLLFGAGVPDHHEHAHHRHCDEHPLCRLVHHHGAERRIVEAVAGSGLDDHCGVAAHGAGVALQVLLCRVERDDAPCGHGHQPDETGHPHRDPESVTSQHQPQQLTESR